MDSAYRLHPPPGASILTRSQMAAAASSTPATANINPAVSAPTIFRRSCQIIAISKAPKFFLPSAHQAKTFVPVSCSSKQYATRTYNSVVRAVATEEPAVKIQEASRKKPKYFFVVANAKFMLDDEEHFQEQLRERLRNYGERNKQQDFWLVIEPKFLDNFPDITKRLKRPAVALVSTDSRWITFMKLRLDRVLRGEFEAATVAEALQSSPVDVHFEKPGTWTAPYPKYETGWWTPFLLPQQQ